MKIGILGGTFDPPHLGHLIAATQIKERLMLDEMWLMPVSSHAFDKKLSPPEIRFAMTKRVEGDGLVASDIEIKLGGVSSTYHTLKYLKETRPDDTFYFCMGSDLLADFHKWNDWEVLVRENTMVIYPRGDHTNNLYEQTLKIMGEELMPQIILIDGSDVVVTNISSSLIRTLIREGRTIKYLVPDVIEEYIRRHNLYIIS
ncbi:nicotinate (nicotinamide) nucleotide adenylyltransferase [Candidatus Woesebacteria bacterium]|nr:nicotinate (nicotinamide) nucleotide adenylyltransferase [Candidatus Woesebacteria bacterium]